MAIDEMVQQDGEIHQKWYHKLLCEKRVRSVARNLGYFALCMLAIYITHSDRVKLDVKEHTRISSSAARVTGGLSINGVSVPYASKSSLMVSINDFTNPTNAYNIRFTKTADNPAESITYIFEKNGVEISNTQNFEAGFHEETREVSFSGDCLLKRIMVNYHERDYKVEFR